MKINEKIPGSLPSLGKSCVIKNAIKLWKTWSNDFGHVLFILGINFKKLFFQKSSTGDDQSISIQMRGGPEPMMVTR
jgi:hypothetical protein